MSEETTTDAEVENKKSPEEIMRAELLTIHWKALKDYIWRTFREEPESEETKNNLKLLKNVIANEEDLAQVKANLTVASIYFDIDRYITLDVEDKDDLLNDVCDMIDDHGLANIRELRRFVRVNGRKYNLPSMNIINSFLRSHTGLISLYFNGVYQESTEELILMQKLRR